MRQRIVTLILLVLAIAAALALALDNRQPHRQTVKASFSHEVVTTTSSTTTIPPTTTTSTTEPPTTTTTAYVRRPVQSGTYTRTTQSRPSRGVATRPSHYAGYATSCMDNAAHTAALAHACWDGLLAKYAWS